MNDCSTSDRILSRRRLLKMGITATAVGIVASGLEFALPTAAEAQDVSTPDAALAALVSGNKRYVSGHPNAHDLNRLRHETANSQAPFAAVLACADSRVPVELIFDQAIGQIFVTRVAGNVVTPEIIGSLEYGAAVLGTKVILVLGHAGCGAVKATIHGEAVPGQISSLFPHIQPAVDKAGPDLEATIKENASMQASLLRESSTVISDLAKQGKVKVVSGYYDLASGAVTMLG